MSAPNYDTPHCAKFSPVVMAAIRQALFTWLPLSVYAQSVVLDPFGGIGGIHELYPDYETHCIELELEWAQVANQYGPTWHGNFFDATRGNGLPKRIDAVVTSPTYGNRMADNHDAKDRSTRITYKHTLGRDPSEGSSCTLQWGPEYRFFHQRAWKRVWQILEPEGVFVLNVKNHVRKRKEMPVAEWHRDRAVNMGFELVEDIIVPVKSMKFGQNHAARADHEHVYVFSRGPR